MQKDLESISNEVFEILLKRLGIEDSISKPKIMVEEMYIDNERVQGGYIIDGSILIDANLVDSLKDELRASENLGELVDVLAHEMTHHIQYFYFSGGVNDAWTWLSEFHATICGYLVTSEYVSEGSVLNLINKIFSEKMETYSDGVVDATFFFLSVMRDSEIGWMVAREIMSDIRRLKSSSVEEVYRKWKRLVSNVFTNIYISTTYK